MASCRVFASSGHYSKVVWVSEPAASCMNEGLKLVPRFHVTTCVVLGIECSCLWWEYQNLPHFVWVEGGTGYFLCRMLCLYGRVTQISTLKFLVSTCDIQAIELTCFLSQFRLEFAMKIPCKGQNYHSNDVMLSITYKDINSKSAIYWW